MHPFPQDLARERQRDLAREAGAARLAAEAGTGRRRATRAPARTTPVRAFLRVIRRRRAPEEPQCSP